MSRNGRIRQRSILIVAEVWIGPSLQRVPKVKKVMLQSPIPTKSPNITRKASTSQKTALSEEAYKASSIFKLSVDRTHLTKAKSFMTHRISWSFHSITCTINKSSAAMALISTCSTRLRTSAAKSSLSTSKKIEATCALIRTYLFKMLKSSVTTT